MSDTEHPLISVIVPVYNVEPYLDRCIQSLVSQTYRNLEIILVDDGSPDKCPQMCDVWAAKDSRIRVIHQENRGSSEARNSGLDVASGEFIGFVDSDDWVDYDMYASLYDDIVAENADIAFTSATFVYENRPSSIKHFFANVHLNITSEEAFKYINIPGYFGISAWCKLLKRSTIGDLRFPAGVSRDEDFDFAFATLAKARRITYNSKPHYNYFQRSKDSISTSPPILHASEATTRMVRLVQEQYPEQLPYAYFKHLRVMIGTYDQAVKSNVHSQVEWKQFLQRIRTFARKHLDIIVHFVDMPTLQLIQIRLLVISPGLYTWCLKLYKTIHPHRAY
jgi:glycosyltransferase involved in cell wall biosynthesis